MNGRRRFAALAGALAIALGACSVPRDETARPINSELLPEFTPEPSNCPPLGPGNRSTVQIFMVQQREAARILQPVDQQVISPPTPDVALRRLFDCPPTNADQQDGIVTLITGLSVDGVDEINAEGHEWEVRLSTVDGADPTALNELAWAQMLFTVTNDGLTDEVEGVRFRVDGELFPVATQGGVRKPEDFKMRGDYQPSTPTTTTTTTTTSTTSTTTTTTTTVAPEQTTTTAG